MPNVEVNDCLLTVDRLIALSRLLKLVFVVRSALVFCVNIVTIRVSLSR